MVYFPGESGLANSRNRTIDMLHIIDKLELCVILCSSTYGVDFFRKFDLVMNALDNRGTYADHCLWLKSKIHYTSFPVASP